MRTLKLVISLLLICCGLAWADDIYTYAERGELAKVKGMLKANPSALTAPGKDGQTLLHSACKYGKSDLVKFLIKAGADVNKPDKIGCTPLHWACRRPSNKKTAEGKLKTVKLLVKAGADLEARSKTRKKAPLHTAGHSWDKRVAEFLIKKGANVNIRDGLGWTPLFWAAHNRYPKTVKALIKHGANVNEQDKYGDTPLHWTVTQKSTEVTKILKRAGADPNIANKNRETPLSKAQKRERKDMVRVLTKK